MNNRGNEFVRGCENFFGSDMVSIHPKNGSHSFEIAVLHDACANGKNPMDLKGAKLEGIEVHSVKRVRDTVINGVPADKFVVSVRRGRHR